MPFRSLALTALIAALAAADGPVLQPVPWEAAAPAATSPRVRELDARTWLHGRVTTTRPEAPLAGSALLEEVLAAATINHIGLLGPCIWVYRDDTATGGALTLMVGFPVAPGTAAPPGLAVDELPALRAATTLYSGPLPALGQAYATLMPRLSDPGLAPTGEAREYYLYFESPESPDNVVLLAAGIR